MLGKFTFQCVLTTFTILWFTHSTILYKILYKHLPVNPISFEEKYISKVYKLKKLFTLCTYTLYNMNTQKLFNNIQHFLMRAGKM